MDLPLEAIAPRFVNSFMRYSGADDTILNTSLSVAASAVWPASSRILYVPLKLPFRFNVRRVFLANGAAVSGHFDIGIYSADGVKLWSAGSTSQAGTSVPQYVTPSPDILLSPGAYYLALALDNTTGTTIRIQPTAGITGRIMGLLQEAIAGAFALPASMTPAVVVSNYLPLFGITSTDTGF